MELFLKEALHLQLIELILGVERFNKQANGRKSLKDADEKVHVFFVEYATATLTNLLSEDALIS